MQPSQTARRGLFAAGSLTAVAAVIALLPWNMGGCGLAVGRFDVGAMVEGTGKVLKATSLSEKDEDSIGQSVAVQATNRWSIYPDPSMTRYVTLVGRTVGASSREPRLKLYFAVLDVQDANAFSGPHGYVFITRGALQRMHDESELAGVLGHEIGHLCKHHGLLAVKAAGQEQGLMTVAAGASRELAQFKGLADAAGQAVIDTGFSQPQEEEADSESVSYVTAAGYDPNGFLRFLQRVKNEPGSKAKPFGTHPGIGDRIQKIRDQISKAHTGGHGATLSDRFAMNVHMQ